LGIVGGLMALVVLLAWLNPRPRTDWQEILQNSKPLFWLFAIVLTMLFVAPYLSTRKYLSDPRNTGATEYHFSDSGVRIEHSTGNADLNWTAFVNAIETRDLFLLYVTQAWARVLPKRCLVGPGELDDLRQLIRTHVLKSKLRGS
jgi:hypothetical protein